MEKLGKSFLTMIDNVAVEASINLFRSFYVFILLSVLGYHMNKYNLVHIANRFYL